MAYLFSGSAQQLNTSSSPVATEPMTLALWINPSRNTAGEETFNVSQSTANIFALNVAGNVAGDPIRVYKGNGAFGVADTSTSFTTGANQHAAGVYASSTSRSAFLNGGGKITNTTSITTTGSPYRIDIGAVRGSSYYNGEASEAAVWSAALTDDEIISLAKGFKPYRVRPQSLVFYAPLVREIKDFKGGLSITVTGSPTLATHPRVY